MKWLAIVAMALAGVLVWFWLSFPTYSYAFRLIINVDTPSGIKSGSSVLSLTWRSQVPIGPRGAVTQVKGEAVPIEIGNGYNLFAILGFGPKGREDWVEHLAFEAFRRAGRPMSIEALAKAKGTAPLTGDLIPTFVTFTDIDDPKTARLVQSHELSTIFGPGVALRDARVEMTNDRITRRIEAKLPWLSHMDQYRTDPRNPFTNTLSIGRQQFVRE